MGDAVVAQSRFETDFAERALADPEEARGRGVDGGREGFFADHGELAAAELDAEGAAPAAGRTVRELGARFPGLVREQRSHFAGFVLGVFVVVDAEAEVEALEAVERVVETRLQIDARLLEGDDGRGFLAVVLFFFVVVVFLLVIVVADLVFVVVFVVVPVVGMAVAGDAVLGVEDADGDSGEAALADDGEADGAAAGLGGAAGHMSADFLLVFVLVLVFVFVLVFVLVVAFLVTVFVVVVLLLFLEGALSRGLGEAGDVVVVGVAREGVDVPRDIAAAAVEPEGPAPAVAVVGTPHVDGAVEAVGHFVRDAAGVDIHHAADGAGTVEQGRRALQDFHPLGEEGIDRDRVVAAADGDVERVDLFLHDAHALAAHAVDDRTPGAHAVGTVVDARLVADGRADVVHHLAFEFVGFQHGAG